MTLTLNIIDDAGRIARTIEADDMDALIERVTRWDPPKDAGRMVVTDDGLEILVVKPDTDFTPPACDSLVSETLARLTVQSLLRKARCDDAPLIWNEMLPADPLITLAAQVLGSERLVLLRRCVPGSRAFPGDWAPAALLHAVIGTLSIERFAKLVSADESLTPREAIIGVMNRLAPVQIGLQELDEVQWGFGERARLLLVARGWLPALDAA